jgi:hypothetical protein
LPWKVVLWLIIPSALTAFGAGLAVAFLERRRNELWGERWLTFWESRPGQWIAKLARLSRKLLPVKRALPKPVPAAAPSLLAGNLAAPRQLGAVATVVQRAESCIRRGRGYLAASSATPEREGRTSNVQEVERERTLERQVIVLEMLLHKVSGLGAATGAGGSFTADLEQMREACNVPEALIEAKEWRP